MQPNNSYQNSGFSVLEVILIIAFVALIGAIGWKVLSKHTASQTAVNTTASQVAQRWTRLSGIIMLGITSTDTHLITPGHYRMYYLDGPQGLVYADSNNGRTWSAPQSIGINPDTGKMVSNPSALQLADGNWIMLYEQAPMIAPSPNGPPPFGPNNEHDLYLATSSNGTSFHESGMAINSSNADGYFASVPDMVLLPDGKIRAYYVSGGQNIASAISTDNGKTWTREPGYRLDGGDPDVFYQHNKWVMYYTDIIPNQNGLHEAISTDGLHWTSLKGQVVKKNNPNDIIIDPDVFKVNNHKYIMNFNESPPPSNNPNQTSKGGLQQAVYNGSIFN